MTIAAPATIREELRAALDALEALKEELERKNRELEAFSYAVSHDLRAPLRSIDGFSQAIAEESTELSPRSRHDLQRIRTAAQHMGALIDDILQLSRVGRADIDRSPVDLAEIARAVGAALQDTHPDRRVDLEIEGPLIANADARLMRLALESLLGNAWKFTAPVPQPRVRFHSQRTANGLAFVVRDNGAGFPMNYVDKLFRPFQRLHMASEFSGTGIGLAMVHRIVNRHGGRVWAEGAEGSGAAIYFTIPQGRSGRPVVTRTHLILLVEDNPDDIELTLRAFERTRVTNQIVVAKDGAEALDYLFATGAHAGRDTSLMPEVVLLDLKLPKVDGLDVLRAMRADERTRRLPVVMLTSSNEERDVLGSYDLGANSFVRKPVDFSKFFEAAQQLGLYWLVVNEPPPS